MRPDLLKNHECETASLELKKLKGCEEALEEYYQYEILGYRFDRCPNFLLRNQEWVYEYLEIWKWREKGFLPFGINSWLELPNKTVEILNFIDHLIGAADAARQRVSNKTSS